MDELQQLQTQIHELQKRAEVLAAQKKSSAITEIKALVQAYGITARELGFSTLGETRKLIVPIKYKLGEVTWSGRGRAPRAIAEYCEKGGVLEDLKV